MRDKKGFTLAELMVVVAIIGVLVAVSVPIFNSQLEKSREATDLANVRSAYAQVMTEAIGKEGIPEPVAVFLKQTQDDWQTKLPMTIGGVTFDGNSSDNWKGTPKGKGMCRVSYEKDRGIIFNWEGGYAGDASVAIENYLIQIKDKSNKDSPEAFYSNRELRIGTKTVKVRIYYAGSAAFKNAVTKWEVKPCTYEQSPFYSIQANISTTNTKDGFAYYTITGEGKNAKVDKLVYVNSTNVYESRDEGRTWYDITPPSTETTTP